MTDERENMEWMNEYQALKRVNPANPFVVPVNYFDEMEKQVMGRIRLDAFETAHSKQEFSVPENYFEQLTQNIQSRIAIEQAEDEEFTTPQGYFEELEQNIQSRITIEQATEEEFTIPQGYFETLEQNIQSRIAIQQAEEEEAFTIPQGYFEQLEQNILGRIVIEQHAEAEFAVPQGYFEALEGAILGKTTLTRQTEKPAAKKQTATLVNMWAKHAIKYASAACFTMVMGTALFLSEFNTDSSTTSHKHSYLHKAVSRIPQDEIETYLQLTTDVPSIIDNSDLDGSETQAAEQIKN